VEYVRPNSDDWTCGELSMWKGSSQWTKVRTVFLVHFLDDPDVLAALDNIVVEVIE
jgi:hypothetical protein